MTDQHPRKRRTLVMGVTPRQHDAVLLEAIKFARQLDAELVMATVDETQYEVYKNPDGTTAAFPIDPDAAEVTTEEFDPDLAAHLKDLLNGSGVTWSLRALAGEPAHELARVAHELDSAAIIVGTRKRGFRTSAHEFFNGSVAAHLAHRQHHLVVVIPFDPLSNDEVLPWEDH